MEDCMNRSELYCCILCLFCGNFDTVSSWIQASYSSCKWHHKSTEGCRYNCAQCCGHTHKHLLHAA